MTHVVCLVKGSTVIGPFYSVYVERFPGNIEIGYFLSSLHTRHQSYTYNLNVLYGLFTNLSEPVFGLFNRIHFNFFFILELKTLEK